MLYFQKLLSVTILVTPLFIAPTLAETHALVVGVDHYRFVRQLHGAVADADDIASTLEHHGVKDVVKLIDTAATRAAIFGALDAITAKVKPNELVIISFAGHGWVELWHQANSAVAKPDDTHGAYILADMARPDQMSSGGDPGARILGAEMNVRLEQLATKGARVVFVADNCFAGAMTRAPILETDEAMPVVRSATPFEIPEAIDPLTKLISSLPPRTDLSKTAPSVTILAAVDDTRAAPEIRIPDGSRAIRGALSYTFARALDGKSPTEKAGVVTRSDLFGYLQSSIPPLAENRQYPKLQPRGDMTRVVIDFARDLSIEPAQPAPSAENQVKIWSEPEPVEAATSHGGAVALTPAKSREDADYRYDPSAETAISAAKDTIAHDVRRADLIKLAEREVARRRLLKLNQERPHAIMLQGGDGRYPCMASVKVDVRAPDEGTAGPEYYMLFDISGVGVVQFLYPLPGSGDDVQIPRSGTFNDIIALPPFGADQLVLITSRKPLTELINALTSLDNKVAALEAVELIEKAWTPDMRIGLQGLYTERGTNPSPKCGPAQ